MANVGTHLCGNCKRDIPTENFMIHEVHCRRNIKLCPLCAEPIPKTELEEHIDSQHAQVVCKCAMKMERSQLEEHQSQECSLRLVKCQFCELEVTFSKRAGHEEYCGTRTERCEKCLRNVMVRELGTHPSMCGIEVPEMSSSKRPVHFSRAPFNHRVLHREGIFGGSEHEKRAFNLGTESGMRRPALDLAKDQNRAEKVKQSKKNGGWEAGHPETQDERSSLDHLLALSLQNGFGDEQTSWGDFLDDSFVEEQLAGLHQPVRTGSGRSQNFNSENPKTLEWLMSNGRWQNGSKDKLEDNATVDHLLALGLKDDLTQDLLSYTGLVKDSFVNGDLTNLHKQSAMESTLFRNLNVSDHRGGEEDMLPCEFCEDLFSVEDLILHQTGCSPSSAFSSYSKQPPSRHQEDSFSPVPPSPLSSPLLSQKFADLSFDSPLGSEVNLPCEFCGMLLQEDVLVQHQDKCILRPPTACFRNGPLVRRPLPATENLTRKSSPIPQRRVRHQEDPHHREKAGTTHPLQSRGAAGNRRPEKVRSGFLDSQKDAEASVKPQPRPRHQQLKQTAGNLKAARGSRPLASSVDSSLGVTNTRRQTSGRADGKRNASLSATRKVYSPTVDNLKAEEEE
ncbi:TRAF-type zinc finger domain-containing protein 1 [Erpetoichthys calabaricus]|uniref:TRAF-type zinc finger domain-containing protein 1 n=1 Tax=Erpetoichthys calabaricus TaxID=27687 RepID=UPI00109F3D2C|nr:TRAF-type zinc finger domain-containing protein 1 [Erpetoichthys calabaricus]